MIYVLATLRTRAGDHTQLMAAARAMVEATHAEPGCMFYELTINTNDPTQWIFVEQWTSREALAEHFASRHMAKWQAASEGAFIERKVEAIYPEKVEAL